MNTSTLVLNALTWRDARTLYPLYYALNREFMLDLPECPALAEEDDCPAQETVDEARQWLAAADQRIQVHQLRQFLQTTTLSSEHALRTLLTHHLQKPEHSDSDRDKIDFLIVQYFAHCASAPLEESAVDLQYVARTLEPVLGPVGLNVPDWTAPLEPLLQQALQCPDLGSLLYGNILNRCREIKLSAAEHYYQPAALIAVARFNFLMRRIFFRLVHRDMNAVLDGLRTLEQRGVTKVDGRCAQLGASEPIERLRLICQSWKVMFFAEYSSGQPVNLLVGLRRVVEEALAASADSPPKRAQSAAAGADSHAAAEPFSPPVGGQDGGAA